LSITVISRRRRHHHYVTIYRVVINTWNKNDDGVVIVLNRIERTYKYLNERIYRHVIGNYTRR